MHKQEKYFLISTGNAHKAFGTKEDGTMKRNFDGQKKCNWICQLRMYFLSKHWLHWRSHSSLP